jgi:hypothetical protein
MQGPTNEAPVPTETVSNGPNLNRTFTVRRRAAKRSEPWYRIVPPPTPQSIAAALPPPPPPPEDEGLPPAKKPRLQTRISISTAADGVVHAHTAERVTIDSHDDKPLTDSVTPAASLPSAAASRDGSWKAVEDAKLTEAVNKHGKKWVSVAAMVSGRTNIQCRQRWVDVLDPTNGNKAKWTPEEDAKLTEAVKQHGNLWVVVAALVIGRTDKQCRQRWINTVDPSNGKNAASYRAPRCAWKAEEDAKLTEAVKRHGNHCWAVVAAMVSGRTNNQCRERWVKTVDPSNGNKVQRRSWKPEEDAKLTEAVNKHGKYCWVEVAAMVSGRTDKQCRARWVNTVDPTNGNNLGRWTTEEDAKLTEAVEKHGKNWVEVAEMVPGRTNRHCRKHWVDTLDHANGNKGTWATEEDTKLTEAVKKHGNHWVEVAAMVSGRTSNQCRVRWTLTLDPAIGKNAGKWTPEEDATLTEAVKKHGKNWVAIAAMVPGRTDIQCRPRWIYTVDPAKEKNASKWTPEEDAMLTEAVKKHGNLWVTVATMVPGRTDRQCRCRYRWVYILDPHRA